MKNKKEKKIIAPNECSFGRWIVVTPVSTTMASLPVLIYIVIDLIKRKKQASSAQ